jgi:hypothetical protein
LVDLDQNKASAGCRMTFLSSLEGDVTMQSTTSKQPLIPGMIARQGTVPGLALVACLAIFAPVEPAAATTFGHGAAALIEGANDTLVTEVARRGGGARAGGARAGGARAGRTTTVRKGGTTVRRTTTAGRGAAAARTGAWARPGHYHWPRGGAIAAGAAIGMVSAATAAAWAGAAPAPGMCWYYTDQSRRQGFWDYCK